MEHYIKGIYKNSIFKSENGYIIGLFKVTDTNDETMRDFIGKTVTFTGMFAELNENDKYFFYGETVNHPRYGFQYNVSSYERVKPEDKDAVVEFLSSNLFKGVGEQLAKKIVDVLGEKALDIILENANSLLLVPKLSSKKAKSIYETLKKYEESHQIMLYLSDLGFSITDAMKIYTTYKNNTISKLENNIYSITDDIDDLSFLKIDEVSVKLNFERDDYRRIKASIIYMMKKLMFNSGDTYLYYQEIKDQTASYLQFSIQDVDFNQYLEELVEIKKVVILNNKYYLYDLYEAETHIVNKIQKLINSKPSAYSGLDSIITNQENINKLSYNKKQKDAIKAALVNNILIITGGPGTGKTTIIKAIVETYQIANNYNINQLNERLIMLAPTGRASKRMMEATGLPAMTIHRFLKWNKENNQFGVNEYNKDNHHIIIVDEVSMIDMVLFSNLLKGLTDNIKLILVGDYHQLPSVGPGKVLKDLIDSDLIKTITLDQLYRQAENSYIPYLANDIKNNELNEQFLNTTSDYAFIECRNQNIKNELKNICEEWLTTNRNYQEIQVMAPMYRGEVGIDLLNQELQAIFNPPDPNKKEIKNGDIIFRENDKILQLVNMPDDNVFNGDIGIICEIVFANKSNSGKNEIVVDYDGSLVRYQPKDFVKIKHGFIISIHKSQGSEFNTVIIPFSMSYYNMLYRRLIYTAITRAKKKLILIGDPKAFVYGVNNNNDYNRKTNLLERLKC